MISKWGVKNFKSILEANLDLAPLTIFTGVNSSGKSSFLHSIAMLKQSFNKGAYVLTGDLVDLGEFKHIYCKKSSEYKQDAKEIDLQFTISSKEHKQIHIEQRLKKDDETKLRLESFSIESKNKEDNENIYLKYSRNDMTKIDDISLEEIRKFKELSPFFNRDIYIEKIHTDFRHSFIPDKIQISFIIKYTDKQINDFISKLTMISTKKNHSDYLKYVQIDDQEDDSYEYYLKKYLFSPEEFYLYERIFNKIYQEISKGTNNDYQDPFTPIFKKYFSNYNNVSLISWYCVLSEINDEEINIIKEEITKDGSKFIKQIIKNDEHETLTVELPAYLNVVGKEIENYFNKKINYLGPLREDPKWTYEFSSAEEINVKGSNALSYYYQHCKENVLNYISPMDIDSSDCLLRTTNLDKALDEWLSHIGIANEHYITKQPDNFKTIHPSEDKTPSFTNSFTNIMSDVANIATLGAINILKKEHNKKVIIEEGDFEIVLFFDGGNYAIPQLGTGVSQILPILLMCLTAPPDSTIIIQEPEQALHPKMQSRLADFFISMALSGRQCIIETHSEYIIEKLRYRIVKEKNESIKSKTKIYFAKKNDGKTEFEEIEISEYGAIMNWPEDFFDESSKWANDIDKAASEKWEKNNTGQ